MNDNNQKQNDDKLKYISTKKIYSFKEDDLNVEVVYKILDDLISRDNPDFISMNKDFFVEEFEVSYSRVSKKNKEINRIKSAENKRKFKKKMAEAKDDEIVEQVDDLEKSSIENFYKNFERICSKHYRKLETYKKEIKKNNSIFIVDIISTFHGIDKKSNEPYKIFKTKEFIKILKKYSEIDYWIFYNDIFSYSNEIAMPKSKIMTLFPTNQIRDYRGFLISKKILVENKIQTEEFIEYASTISLDIKGTTGCKIKKI